MKKIIIATLTVLLAIALQAQTDWHITGNGGTVPGTNFISTTDTKDLLFKTKNIERGRILNAGAWRFGTAANFARIDSAGKLTFGGIGAYQVAGNKYVFQYSGNPKYGLFFNSTVLQYEFRNSNAASIFSVDANSGAVYINGHRFINDNSINNNTSIGNEAGLGNSGYGNTALGPATLALANMGDDNTAVGSTALHSNSMGGQNTAIGSAALYTNSSGYGNTASGFGTLYFNNTGAQNTGSGANALHNNTTGNSNTAGGASALAANTIGNNNTAVGTYSLISSTEGSSNTAAGALALYSNTTAYSNIAVGVAALYSSQTNSNNVAIGDSALLNYTDGSFNDLMLAAGSKALSYNTTGFYNTAVGGNTLMNNLTGHGNTALGVYANVNAGNRINATAIGWKAIATADNQVMLGNTEITSVMAAGSFVIYSDGRFKKNIKENVPGLDFIRQLKPVTYNYDIHGLNKLIGAKSDAGGSRLNSDRARQDEDAINKKEKKLYTGFVAQEVERVADGLGYDFSGVYKPQNDKDAYGLSYADFVVPLVKAVQELSKMNDEKDAKIDAQQKQIDELRNGMQQLQQNFEKCNPCNQNTIQSNQQSLNKQQPKAVSGASLEQNIPNPFNRTTTVNYTLPPQFASAQIIITDKGGKVLKQVNVSGSGKGSVKIDAAVLAAGAYQYSLYINAKLVDTKQMIIEK